MKDVYLKQSFFQKDCDMSLAGHNFYKKGMIIQELGFVDCTYLKGQCVKNTRFLISSAFGKVLPKEAVHKSVRECGFTMLMSESYFKVLDVYVVNGRKQITLLHILKQDVSSFRKYHPYEKKIVEVSRIDFLNSFLLPVNSEITSNAWETRTQFPIGFVDTIN